MTLIPFSQAVGQWEELLAGPLTLWLQNGDNAPSSCAQACSVLATIGNGVLEKLKVCLVGWLVGQLAGWLTGKKKKFIHFLRFF